MLTTADCEGGGGVEGGLEIVALIANAKMIRLSPGNNLVSHKEKWNRLKLPVLKGWFFTVLLLLLLLLM